MGQEDEGEVNCLTEKGSCLDIDGAAFLDG
jgi:hypothetical protein